MNKIGVGIITCNRPDFFKKVYSSIPRNRVDELIVVNDGEDNIEIDKNNCTYVKNSTNLGVGATKNIALRYLLDKNCDYLFLIEDDIVITDENVFDEYIKYIKTTNIQHFMYGYHGPANKKDGKTHPRTVIDYGNNVLVALNYHCVGAFCVYSSQLLKNIGLFDINFFNAWEHVEHSYLAVKNNYLPAFWWWPDIANSSDFLTELACSEKNSTIRPRDDWQKNIHDGGVYFRNKHNYLPWQIPDIDFKQVISKLKSIKLNVENR